MRVVQVLVAEAGGLAARFAPADDGWSVHVTVGHITQTLLTLALIAGLTRWLRLDFGLRLGDVRAGARAVAVLGAVSAVVLVGFYLVLALGTDAARVDAPAELSTLMRYLGFQVLSGPTEEPLFRALPITALAAVRLRGEDFGSGAWTPTLETLVTSGLFVLAHVHYALGPLQLWADPWQLLGAFTSERCVGSSTNAPDPSCGPWPCTRGGTSLSS